MSPRPSPRDLRASDTDRDRVLSMLGEAMSDGRLTADEHAERVQRAIAARTLGELAELTTDLAVSSAQPVRLDGGKVIAGIFGPARRDGRWVVPENLTVTAMFGEVEVDFTQAILQSSRIQLYATVFGGRLRLIVPDGVSVTVSGHMVLGRKRGGTAPPAGPGAPVIPVAAKNTSSEDTRSSVVSTRSRSCPASSAFWRSSSSRGASWPWMTPPRHFSAHSAMMASGVPPMPSSRSMPVPSRAAMIAPATSPSVIRWILAPVSRTCAISFSCRGRSRMTTVTSCGEHALALATAAILAAGDAVMSTMPAAAGPV